jgi:hypothetical protein
VTFTIHLGPALLIAFSVVLFLLVTWFCHREGLTGRDSGGSMGIGGLFAAFLYAIFWLAPSLAALAAWALWLRGAQ